MSRNEKQVAMVVLLMQWCIDQEYYHPYTTQIQRALNHVIDTYYTDKGISRNDLQWVCNNSALVDKLISNDTKENSITMLSMNMAFADYYLQIVKSPDRVNTWQLFYDTSYNLLAKNYLNFVPDMEEGTRVQEIMTEFFKTIQ